MLSSGSLVEEPLTTNVETPLPSWSESIATQESASPACASLGVVKLRSATMLPA